MKPEENNTVPKAFQQEEEAYLAKTLAVVRDNVKNYGSEVARMQADIDEMLEHYHDNDVEVVSYTHLDVYKRQGYRIFLSLT